jgi:hypothetical protein
MDEYTVDYIWVGTDVSFQKDPTLKCNVGSENIVYLLDKCGLNRLQDETSLSDLDKYLEFNINSISYKNTQFTITKNLFLSIKQAISICPTKSIDCISLINCTGVRQIFYCLLLSVGQPKLLKSRGISYGSGVNLFGNKLNII